MKKYILRKKSINESIENKLNLKNLKMIPIKDKETLINIVNKSKPDKSKNNGFWLIDEAIKKDDAYTNIDKPPFYIKYLAYDVDGNIVAIRAFSTRYYKDYDTRNKEFENYAKLIDFQVDSKYKGNNLQKICTQDLENRLKKAGFEGTTLMCYEPSLREKYIKDGYTGDSTFMYKKF